MNLKQVLTVQLKSTHNKEAWFIPLNDALEGLTQEQAAWKPEGLDHSIAELAIHIIFWNEDELAKFLDPSKTRLQIDNETTFSDSKNYTWAAILKKSDEVLIRWEKAIEAADEEKLSAHSGVIGYICTHNAYHTGQIILIRKLQGSWNPVKSKGVTEII